MGHDKRKDCLRNQQMTRLADEVHQLVDTTMPPHIQVHLRLYEAWESVAPPAALNHTDTVMFCKWSNEPEIVVYVDSSSWAAELCMQKELLRLMIERKMEQPINDIRFLVSRTTAQRKRFTQYERQKEDTTRSTESTAIPTKTALPLTPTEDGYARDLVARIQDEHLKTKLYNAYRKDLEWKKGKKDKIEP